MKTTPDYLYTCQCGEVRKGNRFLRNAFICFRVIRQKYSKELEKRVIAIQLAFVWVTAFVVTSPYVAGSTYQNQVCYTEAVWSPQIWVAYIGFWIIIGWGIPLVVITCFCLMILQKLNRAIREGRNSNIQKKRIKRNRDILRLFVIMVCAFFILTTPYAAFFFSATYLMHLRPKTIDMQITQQLNYALFVLMMANSSINPIIYAKLHKGINKSAVRSWNRLRGVSTLRCSYHSRRNTEITSISRGHGSSASDDIPLQGRHVSWQGRDNAENQKTSTPICNRNAILVLEKRFRTGYSINSAIHNMKVNVLLIWSFLKGMSINQTWCIYVANTY